MTIKEALGDNLNKTNINFIHRYGQSAIIGSVIDGAYKNDYSIDMLIQVCDSRIAQYSSTEPKPSHIQAVIKAKEMKDIFNHAKGIK